MRCIATAGVLALRLYAPAQRLRRARTVLCELTQQHHPAVIVVEQTDGYPHGVHRVHRALARISKDRHLALAVYSPQAVRKTLVGNGWATKLNLARAPASRYPELRIHLTQDRKWKGRYWQNMFDAVALGLHHQRIVRNPPSRSR